MVSVPILLYLFDFSPLHATTAALAVVFLAALAGVGPKFKSKDVLIKEAITIWALGLVTNIGLGLIVTKIPDLVILIGFSLVLIGAGYSMLRAPISVRPEKKMPSLGFNTSITSNWLPDWIIWYRWRFSSNSCFSTFLSYASE